MSEENPYSIILSSSEQIIFLICKERFLSEVKWSRVPAAKSWTVHIWKKLITLSWV